MNTHIIVQARMNSSRLPGKVLKTVLGKTLLEYQLERLNRVVNVDQIIVATTDQSIDDAIVELCDRLSIPTYRGSESDVLLRYAEAAQTYGSSTVVRITSDCPLIDPAYTISVTCHNGMLKDISISIKHFIFFKFYLFFCFLSLNFWSQCTIGQRKRKMVE